jgi:hypothetical protein
LVISATFHQHIKVAAKEGMMRLAALGFVELPAALAALAPEQERVINPAQSPMKMTCLTRY